MVHPASMGLAVWVSITVSGIPQRTSYADFEAAGVTAAFDGSVPGRMYSGPIRSCAPPRSCRRRPAAGATPAGGRGRPRSCDASGDGPCRAPLCSTGRHEAVARLEFYRGSKGLGRRWRRGGDSNSRYGCPYAALPTQHLPETSDLSERSRGDRSARASPAWSAPHA